MEAECLAGKKIALLTHGSRGDVQPNVVLALALQSIGAEVTVVALGDHGEFLQRHGIAKYRLFRTTARELFETMKESLRTDIPDAFEKVRVRLGRVSQRYFVLRVLMM